MTENILHDGKNRITAGQYGVISMTMYYGVMTASKALGMDSSNLLYYVMFGIACIMLLFKYCVTLYTELRSIQCARLRWMYCWDALALSAL